MLKPLTVWITTNCGKFFKRWEYQTTWPASWEICMQVRKQQLELDMEQWTGSKLWKEYIKDVYCHPTYLTSMQSTSHEMPGWMKHNLESRLPPEISITSDTQMTQPLWQKVKRNWRASWWKWKSWLTTQHSENKDHVIRSHHLMANRWGNNGNSSRFYFLGLKNHCSHAVKSDGSHEIKRNFLLGRKGMTNLESRNITLSTKVCLVKAMVFPVVLYKCESWTIKKAEHRRIDAFELWCWRRLLRVPWMARRSNQSILKEISPEYHWKDWCWSWSSYTLVTWGEELTHWKRVQCWERLKAGEEGNDRGWDSWMASPTPWTWVWASSRRWWRTGKPGVGTG